MHSIAKSIELLLKYAEKHGLAAGLDLILARNLLMDLLNVQQPFEGEITDDESNLEAILAPMLEHLETITQRDLLEGKIMGILTPRQSEVEAKFREIKESQGVRAATDYFYALSRATNYIKTERIKKNLSWMHQTDFGELQITINLSKPEKDPRDIVNVKDFGYPKCLLCAENVGYAGHTSHPARQNHRILPITMGGEDWYFQYSPYLYYNEHCIPLCGQHRPFAINENTFVKLADFLDVFPHYFVGSNAGLPIVGGSILNHDHFQGGRHTFPIQDAEALEKYDILGVSAEIIKWPMSVVRLKSKERAKIIKAATFVLEKWQKYEDASVDVLAFSGGMPHNTITPIARINTAGEYEFDLVLRNNRTSEEYPDGIFHPHPEVQHIKKENIGLIEVMGMAILPGRLAEQVADNKPDVKKYMGDIFLEVLKHAGVFKTDEQGLNAFKKFMSEVVK